MTQLSPISHLMREPDWAALNTKTDYECARSLHDVLQALENVDGWVYAIRGEATRIFDERRLYEQYDDPAKPGEKCSCTFRWLQIYMPKSYRYCQEALGSRQILHESIPLAVAEKVTRANLRLLQGVSESVRKDPEIHKAASELSEEKLANLLSAPPYHQHIKPRTRVVLNFTPEQLADVEECLESVASVNAEFGGEDLKTREDRIWALAVSWNQDHVQEFAEAVSE